MNIGQLDRLIIIETPTANRGAAGGQTVTWATHVTCWAQKDDLKGSEKIENSAITATTTTTFYIRYQTGINEKMRIYYGSEYYYIIGIKEHGRKAFLELLTEKRDNK